MVKKSHQQWARRFLRFVLSAAILFLPALCAAQEEPENPAPESNEVKVDAEGCEDLTAISKLPGSVIESCQGGDSYEISVPLPPDAQGYAREKTIRGSYEFRSYEIWQNDQQDQAFSNLTQLLAIAGFRIKYSAQADTITARKEDTWILVHFSGGTYNVTVVNTKEEPWTPSADTEAITREMQTYDRAAIYGIQFSDDNQRVIEESSKILFEVLSYLKANSEVRVVVESHKYSDEGSAQEDLQITEKRAGAVVEWLEAHGVSGKRLQPKGMGRAKPISENDTSLEIRRNERIELIRAKA
jgi:outer membrane protein OmpA-like peptidoglycan-associated protein